MKTKIQFDVCRHIGPALLRIAEGYESLAEATNAAREIQRDKKWPVDDLVINRIERTQYEWKDFNP